MDKTHKLDDVIEFGEFIGMTIKEAADRLPKALFKMQNGTEFKLDSEALTYVEEQMR